MQCPEADVRFFDRAYKRINGVLPQVLREDFCGTAAVCAEWVRTRSSNRAIGIDLDHDTLEWGRQRHLAPLGGLAQHVQLIRDNVLNVTEPLADVIAATNFSYFILKTRADLLAYFQVARKSLAEGGVLVLDIFGGSESQGLEVEEKELEHATYIWEQVKFDPISSETLFHIHFELDDGRSLRKAFTYDWRFWSIREVRELLEEAGFAESLVYWEGTDSETGEGNGVFRPARTQENCPGWIAYITAWG